MSDQNKSKNLIPLLIVAAVFVGLFVLMPFASGYGPDRKPISYWLWYFWRSPEWQHGALVLPIIGFIVWKKRQTLNRIPTTGSRVGFVLVGVGLLLFIAGHRANLYYLGYASCHLLAAGITLWIGGWKWIRDLSFPLFFLGFAWPLYFLESQLGFPLRMLMTDVASSILMLTGVDHLKMGTAIVSVPEGRFALEVANPCSGIRSLFALMMIGALFGFMNFTKSWKWLAMCASAVPFAIIGNVVRILLLTFGSMWFGSDFAIGGSNGTSTFHFLAGIAVFVVAAGGMFGFGKLLNFRPKKSTAAASPNLTPHVSTS